MTNPIHVGFIWTSDELILAQRWQLRNSLKPVYRYLIYTALVAVALDGTRQILATPANPLGFFLIFCGLFLLAFPRLLNPWLTRRQFGKRPDCGATVNWTISEEALVAESPQGSSTITWQALHKVLFTPEGCLLYTTAPIFNWLPRHGFKEEKDFARLQEFARNNTQVAVLS